MLAAIVAAAVAFPAPALAATAQTEDAGASVEISQGSEVSTAPASPAPNDPADFEGVVDGEDADGILITLADGADAQGALSLLSGEGGGEDADQGEASPLAAELADAGLAVTDAGEDSSGRTVVAAQIEGGESVADAVARAQSAPGVAAAQPNYRYELIDDVPEAAVEKANAASALARSSANGFSGESVSLLAESGLPNDPYAAVSDPSETFNQYWIYNAGLTSAWDVAKANGRVTVATLDSGASLRHSDLAGNLVADKAWDVYNDAPLSPETGLDGDNAGTAKAGHGSHVAGIIGAVANNGLGIAGASYNARVLPVKITDDSSTGGITTKRILDGLSYVVGLADELNIRVVNLSVGSYTALGDEITHDAVKRARDRGIAVVCAGGNLGRTDNIYPADFDECISVTALNADGTNISWSDYNLQKDISAPGASILSVEAGTEDGYSKKSGTSMAAPIVSGTLALMFSAAPDATVDDACAALYSTAHPITDDKNDRTLTSGTHGAVDAEAAAEVVSGMQKKTFDDVAAGDWFYAAVYRASYLGVMNGPDGESGFLPGQTLTRAMAAQMLYNRLGAGQSAPACGKPDVDQGEWYARAVNWCVSAGIMTGYDDGSDLFGVGDELTREQMAKVIALSSGADTASANRAKYDALSGTDEASAWAIPYLIWAVDAGVVNGVDNHDGTRDLAPLGDVERCQAAQLMVNALDAGIL